MNIPKTVKIGCHQWEIHHKDKVETEGYYGLCRVEDHTIILRKDMPKSKEEEVFLHECIHAINETYGGLQLSENKVNNLALYLLSFINDNQEVFYGKGNSVRNSRKSQRGKTSPAKRTPKNKKRRH